MPKLPDVTARTAGIDAKLSRRIEEQYRALREMREYLAKADLQVEWLTSELGRARADLLECRMLLDSIGFQKHTIVGGIRAMHARILALESMLKSYE